MRLAVVSGRNLGQEIFWRNCGTPLEDALAAFPESSLICVEPGRRLGRPSNRPAWLSNIRTIRRADAVFWAQMHLRPATRVWAMSYAQPFARRSVLLFDAWQPVLPRLARLLKAQQPHTVFVHYSQAYELLRALEPTLPLVWLRMGFNQSVFADLGVERDIYAFSLGRRYEPLHDALLDFTRERGLTYRFSKSVDDPATPQELNELVSRARYFVVVPPNLSNSDRTGSFNPLTMRYLEGPAAGARLLGIPPLERELLAHLPADALVQVAANGSDLAEVLAAEDNDPGWEAARARAQYEVLHHHTWEKRAREIYARIAADL